MLFVRSRRQSVDGKASTGERRLERTFSEKGTNSHVFYYICTFSHRAAIGKKGLCGGCGVGCENDARFGQLLGQNIHIIGHKNFARMPTGLSTSNAVEIRNESGVCDSSALEKGTYRALQTVFLYLFKKKSSAHISPARKQRLQKLKYRSWVLEAELQEPVAIKITKEITIEITMKITIETREVVTWQ